MPKKLLLADDSITIQKVVALTFAGEDIEVTAVPDGSRALDKARELKPDIVLADISMPGLNGYEFCERIRGDAGLAGTPVLLLVGSFEPFDEEKAAQAGASGRLTKPFDTSELVGTVRAKLEEAARERRAAAQPAAAVAGGQAETALVSPRTRESFLGAGRILDLFEPMPPAEHRSARPKGDAPAGASGSSRAEGGKATEKPRPQPGQAMHVIPFPGMRAGTADLGPAWLSEDLLDEIVERVVRRMSQDVVRDVAWEVVPEMAEMIIREVFKDPSKSAEE